MVFLHGRRAVTYPSLLLGKASFWHLQKCPQAFIWFHHSKVGCMSYKASQSYYGNGILALQCHYLLDVMVFLADLLILLKLS